MPRLSIIFAAVLLLLENANLFTKFCVERVPSQPELTPSVANTYSAPPRDEQIRNVIPPHVLVAAPSKQIGKIISFLATTLLSALNMFE